MSPTQRWISRSWKLLVWALVVLPCWTISALSAQDPPASTKQAVQPEQVEERGIRIPVPAITLLPDVTASIDQNWLDNFHAQYKAKIRIVNKGNVPMPPVQVQTLGMRYNPVNTPPNPSQCIANNNCTIKDHRTIGPLAPGEDKKYNIDKKFTAAETVLVEVTIFCNPPNNCAELNGTNNKVRKVLGPH